MKRALAAADRLALSRERLRQSLRDLSAAPGVAPGQRASGSGVAWLGGGLASIPGASLVIEALSQWWSQHPLRMAGTLLADTAKTVLRPVAQRNPLGLVLGAAALGALLVWSRPWRWIFRPALFAGLLPQLFSTTAAHLRPLPWRALVTWLAQPRRPVKKPAPPVC